MEESRALRFPRHRLYPRSHPTYSHRHIATLLSLLQLPSDLRHTHTQSTALTGFAHHVSFSQVMGLAALSRARL